MWWITQPKCKYGVYACLDAPTATNTTTASQWYPIAGAFTNDPINGFSLNADKIQYDGVPSQYFEIDWQSSIQSNTATNIIHVAVKRNDEVLEICKMGGLAKFINEPIAVAGTVVVYLESNDTVQLVIQSSQPNSTITVNHFTTTIRKFYD